MRWPHNTVSSICWSKQELEEKGSTGLTDNDESDDDDDVVEDSQGFKISVKYFILSKLSN